MLPNLSQVVNNFSQTVTLKKTTQTIVNYKPVNTVVESQIKATVQVASDETLKVNNLDTSKSYFTIHSTSALKVNDIVVYKGKNLKVITIRDDSDYGFYKGIGEQVLWNIQYQQQIYYFQWKM